ncbi:MAG: prenyltransferase [bacterium]
MSILATAFRLYLDETRPQFVVLSLVLAFLGGGMAFATGSFHAGHVALAALGLTLLHVSVNVLNDYHDFRSGIDLAVERTPFSGGSGLLPAGHIQPGDALRLGVASFLLSVPIGIYFVLERGLVLLPLFLVGAFLVVAYTPLITRIGWGAAEVCAGLGLGTLPVAGIYYILTGRLTAEALYGSIPSGLLVANLLLLNEFPDVDADRLGKRRTLPIQFGKVKAAWVFTSFAAATYIWIFVGVVAGMMPLWALLGCLTLPFALKAARGAFRPDERAGIVPALQANVVVVLATQALLAFGFVLFRVI